MIYNVNIFLSFLICTCFLKLILAFPYPPRGYQLKRVQWGVNQERLKLVPQEDNAELAQLDLESDFDSESSYNCGQCADCNQKITQLMTLLDKLLGSPSSGLGNLQNPYQGVYGGGGGLMPFPYSTVQNENPYSTYTFANNLAETNRKRPNYHHYIIQ